MSSERLLTAVVLTAVALSWLQTAAVARLIVRASYKLARAGRELAYTLNADATLAELDAEARRARARADAADRKLRDTREQIKR